MESCLFCKIIQGTIPSKKVYENEHVFAFHDIHPISPTHILIVPKVHIHSVAKTQEEHKNTLGELILASKKIAEEISMEDYRIVINNGEKVGQSVFHIHLHLLGGRSFSWPPG